MNSQRTIRPKRIERSRQIYKAIAADAAACGMTPKQFADRFMDQAIRWRGGWSGCCQWRLLPREFPPTFGHGLPLLPTLADHQCVGSSVPWRSGKTCDSAVERLFTGKTWVGLAGVDRWSAQGSAADTWAQNARLRSCRALRACRYDSWGAIGDHARIFLASLPKRCR